MHTAWLTTNPLLRTVWEKLLMPGAPHQQKKDLLDAAIEDGMVRVASAVDPDTGKPLASLELVPEHARVRAVLDSQGTLPSLLELRGEPLSATVQRARDEDR